MVPTRRRLDAELVRRGLAGSRNEAQRLISVGGVTVGGKPVPRPATLVAPGDPIEITAGDRWASRAGGKLAAAIAAFEVAVAGRKALDVGASTGGFTDVLLANGAASVTAVDVGYGQLLWRLRTDPRVVVMEGVNARALTPAQVPGPFDVVTIDVAFISLRHILPALPPLLAPGADVVALVKPQFEAGRREVGRGGIVSDPAVQQRVVDEVVAAASAVGLERLATTESPITGTSGNREFFVHLRRP